MGKVLRPRVLQLILTVLVILLVILLCHFSDLKKLFVSILIIFVLHHIGNLLIYIDIVNHGILGAGTIVSCKPRLFSSVIIRREGLDLILHGFYKPIAMFFLDEKKCEDELWGAFYKKINENDNFELIFDKKSGRLIPACPKIMKTYIVHTTIWCTFLITLIIFIINS